MPYNSEKQADKQARKKPGKKARMKQGESADDSKPHAASLVSQRKGAEDSKPHAAGVDVNISEKISGVSAVEEPVTRSSPERRPCGPFEMGQSSSPDSTPQIPTLETLNIDSEVPASKDDEGVESDVVEKNASCGASAGGKVCGLFEDFDTSSHTEDGATVGAEDDDSISFLVEAQAKLERKIKVLKTLSLLGKPAHDSGYESPEEASVDSDDGVTEWFEGEKDGYHFRVPMEVHEEGKRMGYFALLKDVCARQEQIVKDLQREKKATAAIDRWSTCWDVVDDFVPPPWFYGTSEPEINI